MKKIAIVGAGQGGMVLAFGLLDKGYDVTVFEGRLPGQIEWGQILSTAMVFDRQLAVERRYGLHAWEGQAPVCNGMHLTLHLPNGQPVLSLSGGLDETCQGVDARLKTSAWLRLWAERGGKTAYGNVDRAFLDELTREFDLVLVATGKGALSGLFPRDEARCLFSVPARKLGAVVLKNVQEWAEIPYTPLKFHFFMEIGEYFALPFYSHCGPCRGLIFDAVPGGPLDLWDGVESGDRALATALKIIREYTPEDYPHYTRADLADERAWIKGAITPTVRKPTARMASGGFAMGLGDALVLNDPLTGTGANDAVRMADRFLDAIVERGQQPFTEEWAREVFDRYYEERGRYTMQFTKIMTDPISEPGWKVMQAAAVSPGVAHTFVNVYTDIRESLRWLTEMPAADAVCARYAHELAGVKLLTRAEARARFAPPSQAVAAA
jgi:hypothetical protein